MGRGLGKLLAQKGAHVVIVARNKDKLDEALEYISVCSMPIKPNPFTPLLTRHIYISPQPRVHKPNASTPSAPT